MNLPNPVKGSTFPYTEEEIKALSLPSNPICPGCNYHTKWQSRATMRFVLDKVEGNSAWLHTRTTGKRFTTFVDQLIFIKTKHNYTKYLKKMNDDQQGTNTPENIGRGDI